MSMRLPRLMERTPNIPTYPVYTKERDLLRKAVICIPVFNDWDSVVELLSRIDSEAASWDFSAQVLIVDDGSTAPSPRRWPYPLTNLEKLEILGLRRNLGHQRAIAVGLAFIHDKMDCDAVVVMDGDGEDSAKGIAKLAKKFRERNGACVVFAKRARRAEGLLFKSLYILFRFVHRILTGRKVEVGNFSMVPRYLLDRLVVVSETWNHYAASVDKARLPVDMVPVNRERRIAGDSKMNFVSLTTHGLSAMSVFADIVGARLLMGSLVVTLLVGAGLAAAAAPALGMQFNLPVWVAPTIGLLLVILLQTLVMSLVFVFIALHGRASLTFLPIRDYHYFVQGLRRMDEDDGDAQA